MLKRFDYRVEKHYCPGGLWTISAGTTLLVYSVYDFNLRERKIFSKTVTQHRIFRCVFMNILVPLCKAMNHLYSICDDLSNFLFRVYRRKKDLLANKILLTCSNSPRSLYLQLHTSFSKPKQCALMKMILQKLRDF